MTEADWQKQVIELARLFKWRVAHFRPAQTKHGWATPVAADGKGWPDLVLCRERVIYAELKAEKGKVGDDQLAWGLALIDAGQEVYVWRPSEWDDVVNTLRRRNAPSRPSAIGSFSETTRIPANQPKTPSPTTPKKADWELDIIRGKDTS